MEGNKFKVWISYFYFFAYCCAFLFFESALLAVVIRKSNGNFAFEVDFEPFRALLHPTLSNSIGHGMEFLNRHMSAKMFNDKESMQSLLEFLRVHSHMGKVCQST